MLQTILLLLMAALLASLLQGLTGFGYSLILIAVLVAFGGEVASASYAANITTLFCQGVIIYRLRGRAVFGSVWTLLVGAAIAVPAGILVLMKFGAAPWLPRAFGVFVTLVAIWLLIAPKRPHVAPRPRRLLGLGAGLLSGLASGMFNTGGPPAVLYTYSRPIPLDAAKATVQWLFTGMSLYRLAVLYAQGAIPTAVTVQALSAAPMAMLGAAAGMAMARRVHPDLLRKSVFVLLIVVGLKLAVWP